LIGGGGWDMAGRRPGRAGVAAFVAAAEAAGIPVTAAFRRNDLIDNLSPAWIGDAGLGKIPPVRRALAETDCLLAVNERFGEITTDGYTTLSPPHMRPPLIHVHPSSGELGKVFQGGEHIQAAPDAFLSALAGHDLGGPGRGDWMAGLRRDYEASLEPPEQTGPVDMRAVMRHLREALPDDAIVTNGAGNFAIWPGKQLPFRPGQRWLAPQAGAMGAGLPAAVAAKIARPDAVVVCFAGDGDLQMTMTELGTAMQHDARPIVLVLDNASYGTIRMHQEREYPGRVSATGNANPDFCAIARAYGMLAERLERTEDFAPAFERAVASPTGALIAIPIPVEQITPARRLSEIRGG
ncbi:MAG TPA: thiamine pyrophosphate-dependent enzyme, partial [Thermohalobaculum sp.]|nr:thiamine pyrophosphate-dependent enzyme [Thermohalobaculum sp.]